MLKHTRDDGVIAYELSKLDIVNIVIAHIERGSGRLVAGGNYEAEVVIGAESVTIEVTPQPKPEAPCARS